MVAAGGIGKPALGAAGAPRGLDLAFLGPRDKRGNDLASEKTGGNTTHIGMTYVIRMGLKTGMTYVIML